MGVKMRRKTGKRACSVIVLLAGILIIVLGFMLLRFRGSTVVHAGEMISSNPKIVFYRQDDEQWAAETMGDSAYTLAESGCLVSCIASAVTMMGNEKTPYALNEMFSGQNVFDAEGNLLWDNLRNTGEYEAEVFGSVTEELLTSLLKEGKYPIVRVRMYGLGNFHYVLIVKAEAGEYYCMDPLRDGLVPLSLYGNRVYAVRCVYPK
ncbi:MAG: hypothetical protein K2N98_01855 [Lachnospiraceae bacterium]|nr:hypothetical protein [Lachnospiraceae bacterium]